VESGVSFQVDAWKRQVGYISNCQIWLSVVVGVVVCVFHFSVASTTNQKLGFFSAFLYNMGVRRSVLAFFTFFPFIIHYYYFRAGARNSGVPNKRRKSIDKAI
jgi:hypothetical protein